MKHFKEQFLNKKFRTKFLLVSGTIAGVYLFLAVAVTVVLVAREDNTRPPSLVDNFQPAVFVDPIDISQSNEPEEQPEILEEYDDQGGFLRPSPRTNFLFVGLDNNLLTDAIMAGVFYRDTGQIKLMSIPRDTFTRIPEHRLEQMRADGLRPPATLKINAMRAFGGSTYGIYYLKAQLGEMLGVQFHYYVEVELAAFRHIVDAIGGVEMYIPRHLFYEDPYQNLLINIPPGMQHLDGQMAEGVVRFRSFPTGDLMRNEMQMEFMSQMMRQILTREAIMNNPLTLFNTILTNVNTNVGFDVLRYLPYIGNISACGITTYTLPGAPANINGISWFMPDAELLPAVVNDVFYYFPGMDEGSDDEQNDEPNDEEDENQENEIDPEPIYPE